MWDAKIFCEIVGDVMSTCISTCIHESTAIKVLFSDKQTSNPHSNASCLSTWCDILCATYTIYASE